MAAFQVSEATRHGPAPHNVQPGQLSAKGSRGPRAAARPVSASPLQKGPPPCPFLACCEQSSTQAAERDAALWRFLLVSLVDAQVLKPEVQEVTPKLLGGERFYQTLELSSRACAPLLCVLGWKSEAERSSCPSWVLAAGPRSSPEAMRPLPTGRTPPSLCFCHVW